jgi:hypothetical protein
LRQWKRRRIFPGVLRIILGRGSTDRERTDLPAGVFRHFVEMARRVHLTAKPVPLMHELSGEYFEIAAARLAENSRTGAEAKSGPEV